MVFEKLKEIITDEVPSVDVDKISMDAKFAEDLNMDSLDVVQIVMAVEDEFGIEVPDDAAEKFANATVGDVVREIQKATGDKED